MATARIELFKGKKYSDGSHPIMLRLTHKSKTKYIHLGASVKVNEWIGEPEKWVAKSYAGFKRLNYKIDNALSKARSVIFELDETGKYFTADDIKKKYSTEKNDITFQKYAEELILNMRKANKHGNADAYQTALNVINKYVEDQETPFPVITRQWLEKFENSKLEDGISVNGLSTYLRTIRAIFNKAIADDVASRELYPFGRDGYKIQHSPTSKRAISAENIDKIKSLNIAPYTNLWHAKNYFLFSFYTRGMNWVDMAHLKKSNIVDGRINYIRKKTARKTSKSFSIKIIPQIQEIIDNYLDYPKNDDYIFPIIQNDESPDRFRQDIKNSLKIFNKNLKKIAVLCGIGASLSSYTARHSWGTIAKRKGVNINTISDGYGHADSNVTRVYLDSIENDDIDKANELIIQ